MGQASFTSQTFSFLRGLKRHNDRDWFRERRAMYEEHVRGPMVALVDRLAGDFAEFAPDLVAVPRTSIFRIYRDTRFSDDKSPLKTHIAAVFPCRALPRHEGAGLYVEIGHDYVYAGGGMYAPQPIELQRIRQHIAARSDQLRSIVESPAFVRTIGRLDGQKLQRVPRGFPGDHPAAEYLKHKQFLAAREYPAAFALSVRFYRDLLGVFRLVTPLVRFLNEPLVAATPASATYLGTEFADSRH